MTPAASRAAGSGRSTADRGRRGRTAAGPSRTSPSVASTEPSGWMTAVSSPEASRAPLHSSLIRGG